MESTKTIKSIDSEHIAIIETFTSEQLMAKKTLEVQKIELQKQIADIDELLTNFK